MFPLLLPRDLCGSLEGEASIGDTSATTLASGLPSCISGSGRSLRGACLRGTVVSLVSDAASYGTCMQKDP